LARGDSPAGCRTRDRMPSDSCGQRGRRAGVAPQRTRQALADGRALPSPSGGAYLTPSIHMITLSKR
jgi:hypothetical protein